MKFVESLVFTLFMVSSAWAQNPITPPGVYIADPSVRIWDDGMLYVYGSLDESTDYYCSRRHHVLFTEDLRKWTLVEDIFASKGVNDQVPYNDELLFAPDCMFRDGTYYLYYCQPDRGAAEGIAVSKSPAGPFLDGRKLNLGIYNQIDPSVFIDDDGQAYYVWGQFTAKMAKLKKNMLEIDTASTRDSIVNQDEHYFHEGAFLTKRKGTYYLVYADISRAGRPTCIGYATASSPFGPYTYGGVIVDNDHCDPGVWNNHGSIAEFRGQWYVFYHRSTHDSKMMRKTCIEPIEFNDDGSIDEVEMTSQGAGPPLSAYAKLEAESVCLIYGNARIEQYAEKAEQLGKMRHDDHAVIKYVDFGSGIISATVRLAPGIAEGTLFLKADYPWGKSIAKVSVPKMENDQKWMEITVPAEKISGVHALWLSVYSSQSERKIDCAIDWLTFSK